VTIQGVNREKIAKEQTVAPRMRTGQEVGNVFWNGKTFMKRAIANKLSPAIRNAERAQKTAGSLPANLLAWVTLHPATEKAKKAKERLTQWR
jgi:hypothetical protein